MQELTTSNYQLQVTDPAAIAAAETAKQRIQAAYIIAMNRPRNVENARVNILNHCKRPNFAEKAEYAKPIGKGVIHGASIRFAEMALREWGNVTVDPQVVYEDEKIKRIKVIVTDLETNTSFSKEIQINKTVERKNPQGREKIGERKNVLGETVYIVKATEDELLNKEAAMISKAIRNEGLRLIPEDIIEEALATCRRTLQNRDAQNPDEAKRRLIDAFAEFGVYPDELEKFLGHSIKQITTNEIQELRTIYQSIKQGESRWVDYLPDEQEKKPKKALFEEQKEEQKEQKKETKKQVKEEEKTQPNYEKELEKLLEKAPVNIADIRNYCEAHKEQFEPQKIIKNLKTYISKTLDWIDAQAQK